MSVVMLGKGVLLHREAPPTVYVLADLHAWKEENEAEFQGGSEEVCVCLTGRWLVSVWISSHPLILLKQDCLLLAFYTPQFKALYSTYKFLHHRS